MNECMNEGMNERERLRERETGRERERETEEDEEKTKSTQHLAKSPESSYHTKCGLIGKVKGDQYSEVCNV